MSREHVGQKDIVKFADERVNLKREDAKELREQVWRLRDRLEQYIADHPDFELRKMMLSGSLAKGTALKTINDVDVACYISMDKAPVETRDLMGFLATRLRTAFPNFSPEQVKPNEYSVTVTFVGTGLRVDVVPILYEGDPDWRGYLISKETGERLMTSIPMHLEFSRRRKQAHPTHYAQIVRLLKHWICVVKQSNEQFRFKSFMVELVMAKLVDGNHSLDDYASALLAAFNYLASDEFRTQIAFADYYDPEMCPKCENPIRIWDPVNSANNVSKLYTAAQRDAIVNAALDAGDAIASALRAPTKTETLRYWRKVFGSSFDA